MWINITFELMGLIKPYLIQSHLIQIDETKVTLYAPNHKEIIAEYKIDELLLVTFRKMRW